jgi:hypothetical protein
VIEIINCRLVHFAANPTIKRASFKSIFHKKPLNKTGPRIKRDLLQGSVKYEIGWMDGGLMGRDSSSGHV